MSEQFPGSVENQESYTAVPEAQTERRATQSQEQRSERSTTAAPTTEALRREVEQAATNAQEMRQTAVEQSQPTAQPILLTGTLKRQSLQRNLGHIRAELNPAERVLSKVMHQPAIKATSELAARTVARPSGLLGGGICAFLGSAGFLYAARHIGFSYNYFLFSLLFVGGFVAGLILELVISATARTLHRK